MKISAIILIVCIMYLAAPSLAASAFSANELKSLLGAKGGNLDGNHMKITLVGMFCLNPETEAMAKSTPDAFRPGFPYLWWKGGRTHPAMKIPRLEKSLIKVGARLDEQDTKEINNGISVQGLEIEIRKLRAEVAETTDPTAKALVQANLDTAITALRNAFKNREAIRLKKERLQRRANRIQGKIDRPHNNKLESADYYPIVSVMNSLNSFKINQNPLLRVSNDIPNKKGFQSKNDAETSAKEVLVDRHAPIDGTISEDALRNSKIMSCHHRDQMREEEQAAIKDGTQTTPEVWKRVEQRYIRVWMEQNHNGQRWTYIMDFWQRLKGNTKIWVTKGRTPGSNVFIKIGNHLPRKLPRGCEFPKPPKPPTKCQTSYQLGAQLSQTIGDMVIKDEQKKADIKRLELVEKYQSSDASEDEGNLGEDVIMRLPSAAQKGDDKNEKLGKVVYYEKAEDSMTEIPAGV
jgi:hypothetical protein